ncbi:MAG: TolC family protein [Acidobacteria bacterium]|nr:TolC family protein [Acidobacteriota bacterium]
MRERFVSRQSHRWWVAVFLVGWFLSPAPMLAQPVGSGPLALNDAVQLALKNYPAIQESRARSAAAQEGIAVARTAYLPRLDVLWQQNRATRNNIFGLLLPQGIVPPISGPVLGTQSSDSVWGSAGGALLSWDAIDFGYRKANVDLAHAQYAQATAQNELTQLDVTAAAADAFLTVLAADAAVRAARANVDRLQVFADTVGTLVRNQLRPGADASRADAELAIAKNQLSLAVLAAEIARATLANAIGTPEGTVDVAMGRLTDLPEVPTAGATDVKFHPAARAQSAVVDTVRARERALGRSTYPHVIFQSAFADRGSGAQVSGQPSLGNGLWPQLSNWAAGISVTFPLLDVFTVEPRKRLEVQNELAASARYEQTLQNLTTQDARARALMKAASEIAQNTPAERRAATDAESRARARYESGLANITEVAEAQRLLAQAEADDAVARLGVWRALLAAAQVRGNLTPFLEKTR